jgi:hypothetical protein
MLGLLSYKSLGQMQQSRELLQQSLAAVPLRSPVRIYVEKSSEDCTIFRRALPSINCWIEVEFSPEPALALLRMPGCSRVRF